MTDFDIRAKAYPLIRDVADEFLRSRALYPPENNENTLAFAEEAGELVKAALDHKYGKTSIAEVRREMVQVISMVLRLYMEGDSTINLPPVKGVCP